MLKYLVESTEQLITVMLMMGVIAGYIRGYGSEKEVRVLRWVTLAGLILSVIMTWFKVMTNKIDTGRWNLRIYTVTLAAFLLFLLGTLLRKKIGRLFSTLMLSVFGCMLLVYFLPFFMEMPHTILLTEDSVFTSTALRKLIGLVLGFGLTLLAEIAVSRAVASISHGKAMALLCAVALVNTINQVAASFGILLAKRMIATNHTLFLISKYASNYSFAFIVAIMILCTIPAIDLWISSFRVNEPYTNSAEHRKIIAKWKKRRKWSTTAVVTFVLSALILTAVSAYANKKVELSPIEDADVEDGYVVVPFEKVSDGHLHRFGYTTENGITVRFIVIQKPNSSSYGVGLDACDICGETGYYEKDGQVVCNLCDVVMNINTIGFKGGCNPIVIKYEISNGSIRVPVDGLVEYESEFK